MMSRRAEHGHPSVSGAEAGGIAARTRDVMADAPFVASCVYALLGGGMEHHFFTVTVREADRFEQAR